MSHLYVASKGVKYIDAERTVVTRKGRCWPKDTKFGGMNKSRDLLYSTMLTVNHSVLNSGNLLDGYISCALSTKGKR